MSVEQRRGGGIILFTFVIAYMLAIIPLPHWVIAWRPDWVAMVLLYWSLALPQRVGVGSAWTAGLVHDLLSDTLLGQHALSYSIIAYLAVISHHRVRLFLRWQQAGWVFIMILLSQLLHVWMSGMQGYSSPGISFAYPAITSMLLWRWTFVGLRDIRRFYRVS